ncbi:MULTISPECIES: murein L,D-transpeptidase family protein [Rhodopseudomonas]|uniref:L,D-TPase catalytic domain-containing protein n=1 Tax=Rhodopseudomonas palustris TaxID=1076 RepID=A0A0D7DWS3_RHOPL|nr:MULTISPECIES: murein L,D-transpeptidase family protein [Rhodopseudomonas]KIZ33033.1 hypothetical protein OO17_29060 [Rhodopseudomonas palustris]MDF3813433.1 hypothetical protein [Rhodopseudomonas sp. BAL398]WOK16608.1 hypothetical protein RBJ75_21015 [Rhodopseudomonas sp. BAL398]
MINLPGRALVASAVLAAGLALAGCNSDQISLASNAKANQPVPPRLVSEMQTKDMDLQSPILVRLFKQEAELEIWKQTRSGRFALLKTYPICRWSGDLGPKIREGDRQAPEGFYAISPGQMNPQSSYYLSFNTGYPNAFDRALGRTGSQLMVHGDCSSRGCYAMTDEQIAEIYSLGRESFFGGQRAFQLQAYPFRMTPANLAKHRNNPNMPFWKMLKEGNDHFEVTRQEPKVDFCEKKYVFDAAAPPDASQPLSFNPAGKCPAYVIPDSIASAVKAKERSDDIKTAELISKGMPVARLQTGIDGGMNRVFAAKLPDASTGLSEGGDSQSLALAAMTRAPGTIPPTVNPPRISAGVTGTVSEPAAAVESTAPKAYVASVESNNPSSSSNFFSSLASKVGIGSHEAKPTAEAVPLPIPRAKPKTAPRNYAVRGQDSAAPPRHQAQVPTPAEPPRHTAAARPQLKPSLGSESTAALSGSTMAGAAPVVSTNSFDSRFSAAR